MYIRKVPSLPELEKSSREPLISREMYDNAVKKMQEQSKHSKQESFIERLNYFLPTVDFDKLDESCSSVDNGYAKEILKQMHDILVEVYRTDYFDDSIYEFIEIPAVIQGRESGHIGLGIIALDLESSTEHWRTWLLTPEGVIEQKGKGLSEADANYARGTYIPCNCWYAASVEQDIHVNFDHVPEKTNGMFNLE